MVYSKKNNRKIVIDYKKELEAAAKSMILIHDPQTLIKMIVRRLVQRVGIKHAGILLYNKEKHTYVLTVSRGASGYKIPAGYARMDSDNPLIRFFKERYDQKLFDSEVLEYKRLKYFFTQKKQKKETANFLKKVSYQMEIFDAIVCVPSFFRDELIGILLLGVKERNAAFKQEELDFFAALASDVAMAIRNAQLFKELESELQKRRSLFLHTTIALAATIDAKDHYTHGHISRVTNYSMAIGQKLKETKRVDDKFIEDLHIASLLHDIGKIATPERILNKTAGLTIGERKVIQQHPLTGVTILQAIRELHDVIPGVKYHHERYDGKGYPEGLKGKEIPLSASIISVADTFDAMTTDRPYRKALTREEALLEMKRCSGTQFDPDVVRVACKVLSQQI